MGQAFEEENLQGNTANGILQDQMVNAGKMIDVMSLRQYFDLSGLQVVYETLFYCAGGDRFICDLIRSDICRHI